MMTKAEFKHWKKRQMATLRRVIRQYDRLVRMDVTVARRYAALTGDSRQIMTISGLKAEQLDALSKVIATQLASAALRDGYIELLQPSPADVGRIYRLADSRR